MRGGGAGFLSSAADQERESDDAPVRGATIAKYEHIMDHARQAAKKQPATPWDTGTGYRLASGNQSVSYNASDVVP